METIKKKALYPYVILELILFIVSYVFAVNPIKTSFDYRIITIIGLSVNVLYIIMTDTRKKKDIIFGLAFTIFFLLSFIMSYLSISLFSLLFSFLSFSILLLRISLENGLKKGKLIPLLFDAIILIALLITKPLDYVFIQLITSSFLIITTVVYSIIQYKNGPTLEKPNWFFQGFGAVIYLVYFLCYAFGPLMDETALLKGMVSFASVILVIPSIVMVTISFTLFQPREA